MELDLKKLFQNNAYDEGFPKSAASSGGRNKAKVQDSLKAFHRAWNKNASWREMKKLCDNFYDGDQLTAEEREKLKMRSQPDVTINKIHTQVNLVQGLQSRFKKRVKVFNRTESEDDLLTAEAFSEALRYVDQFNQVEFQDELVFEDGLIGGRGWMYVHVELDQTDFEPEIKLSYINSEDIIVDLEARQFDLKDAKKMWHTVWMDEDDLYNMFPKKERLIKRASASFMNENYGDVKSRKFEGDDYLKLLYTDSGTRDLYYDRSCGRIRVMNHWYKKLEDRTVIMHPDLGMGMVGTGVTKKTIDEGVRTIAEQTGIPPEVFSRPMEIIKVSTMIGGEELEEKDSPYLHNEFPFIPYTCFRNRQSYDPYGIVKNAIDPQREVNKRRSKALHALNTQRIIAEDGAVDDEEVARAEVARPDAYVKTNRGFKFEIQTNSEIGSSQLDMYRQSIMEIQEVTGITPDLQGLVTNARSGTAIDKRLEQGIAVLSKVFTHWRWYKLNVARQVVALIQQYWTDEKAIRVSDDQEVVKFLHLNKQVQMPNGETVIMRNVQTGKYDVIFDETEGGVNYGEDVFSEMAKLAQTGAIPPDIVMEFAPIPHGIKKRILERLQPQAAPTQGQGEAAPSPSMQPGQVPVTGVAQ